MLVQGQVQLSNFTCIANSIIIENNPMFGATRAIIIENQKDARNRVFLFFWIYITTGTISLFDQ